MGMKIIYVVTDKINPVLMPLYGRWRLWYVALDNRLTYAFYCSDCFTTEKSIKNIDQFILNIWYKKPMEFVLLHAEKTTRNRGFSVARTLGLHIMRSPPSRGRSHTSEGDQRQKVLMMHSVYIV